MMQLELPHVNVLTKMDLLKDKRGDVEQCAFRLCARVVAYSLLTSRLVWKVPSTGCYVFCSPAATCYARSLPPSQ